MALKKINKKYSKVTSATQILDSISLKSKFGIIYTLYSDKFNSIELGYAENTKTLKDKLLKSNSILLDMKKGKERELNLLIKTLNELNINCFYKLHFKYSDNLIRHLSTLGWPVGKSLFKQRRIKKVLSFA